MFGLKRVADETQNVQAQSRDRYKRSKRPAPFIWSEARHQNARFLQMTRY